MQLALHKVLGIGESQDNKGKWLIWSLRGGIIWLNEEPGDLNLAWVRSSQSLCLYDNRFKVKAAALSWAFKIKSETILSDLSFCAFEDEKDNGKDDGEKDYLSLKLYDSKIFSSWFLKILQPYNGQLLEVFDYRVCPLMRMPLSCFRLKRSEK